MFAAVTLVIAVYDIANRQSFDNISSHLVDVVDYANPASSIVLVGNKADQEMDRVVTAEEAQRFAAKVT